ncbi:4-hydroxythreonine-4-phosphate dehydrogenase PdxA [bacterium]|nr:MAG: 4-hydroxythreonine-4-phosphate dehydrogenase PdxA [bacterium]
MAKPKIVCGITMGDPSGIGPEVMLKALNYPGISNLAEYLVIGDGWVLEKLKVTIRKPQDFRVIDLKNVPRGGFAFGKVRREYGKASMQYIDKAIELLKDKKIDCLVTGPVNKKSVNLSGYNFSGQTEYISKPFAAKSAVMMLLNKKLRVSLVTRHIPLRNVVKNLNARIIAGTIISTASGLKSFFSIKNPRIAVCAVNPHASDNGVMGDEEAGLIAPAIAMARGGGVICQGPYPADTLFAKAISGEYDCVICMYHDQGLIPLKLTGLEDAVNITLGLPFARTSPGHGTAFDIAGKGVANPRSFIEAVKTAVSCAMNLNPGKR